MPSSKNCVVGDGSINKHLHNRVKQERKHDLYFTGAKANATKRNVYFIYIVQPCGPKLRYTFSAQEKTAHWLSVEEASQHEGTLTRLVFDEMDVALLVVRMHWNAATDGDASPKRVCTGNEI